MSVSLKSGDRDIVESFTAGRSLPVSFPPDWAGSDRGINNNSAGRIYSVFMPGGF
ncbi:MAG TPA: hypothetical protein PLO24_00420 [Bacteroidales bacterium]|nr:hypothetical protein [Bacteroidales bacterium]HOS71755.1 hypothetical protein [Bacteroidales bacterium]